MKILFTIPGPADKNNMLFAQRQIESISHARACKTIFLESKSLIYLFKKKKEIKKTITEFKPTIIHNQYGSWSALYMNLITRSVPIVITLQGSDINHTPTDGFAKDLMARCSTQIACLLSKKIICVSSGLKDKIFFGKKKAVVLPNGIELQQFYEIDKTIARQQLQWNAKEKIILFNANNPNIKRLDIANAVAKILTSKSNDFRLEILNGKVEPDKINLMLNAADCLLVCSNSEGSPTIVKEAMACNLPIVSTDVGDVVERISNTSPHKICLQNADELAIAIEDVLNKNIRSNGREELRKQQIDADNTLKKIMTIYNNLSTK